MAPPMSASTPGKKPAKTSPQDARDDEVGSVAARMEFNLLPKRKASEPRYHVADVAMSAS
jgi:hypothetical protein